MAYYGICYFSMPYCEAVLTEVLRIRPIATIAVPHSNVRDAKFRGYDIPKVK